MMMSKRKAIYFLSECHPDAWQRAQEGENNKRSCSPDNRLLLDAIGFLKYRNIKPYKDGMYHASMPPVTVPYLAVYEERNMVKISKAKAGALCYIEGKGCKLIFA